MVERLNSLIALLGACKVYHIKPSDVEKLL